VFISVVFMIANYLL